MRIEPDDIATCLDDDRRGVGSRWDADLHADRPHLALHLSRLPGARRRARRRAPRPRLHPGSDPTVEAVERKLAALERGEACKCFGSGMAAISAVLLAFLHAGDHVLFVNHTYGPTLQLAESLRRLGIQYDRLLDLDAAAVEAALRPETRLVRLESPGTMLFRVLDLEAVAGLARERGIPTCIDNSWATPLCQKPLAMGIDLVVHTCTKYLGGHSDLVAGAVMGSEERIAEIFERTYLLLGGILGPFEAWLLLRGAAHPPCPAPPARGGRAPGGGVPARHRAVRRVFPPAFAEERALVERQLSGYSGLLSFELAGGDFEDVRRVIDALRVPRIGVSWGGVESLVLSPNRGTNGPWLDAQGIPRGLIRLSVGLEGAEVLIEDLGQALATRS